MDEDDTFPQQVCNTCIAKLLAAEEIKSKYIQSDKILRGFFIPKVEIKAEVEDVDLEEPVEYLAEEYDYDSIKEESNKQKVQAKNIKKKVRTKKITKREESLNLSCELCSDRFSSNNSLTIHIKEEHKKKNDEPLHTCQTCDDKFYTTQAFEKHRCGLRPICYYCSIQFEGKTALLMHMRTDHVTEENMFECDVEGCGGYKCQKATTMFYHLTSHYEPLELICPHCSRVYNNLLKYKKHLNNHAGQIQIECDYCGIRIFSKNNMMRHMRTKHLNTRFVFIFVFFLSSFLSLLSNLFRNFSQFHLI